MKLLKMSVIFPLLLWLCSCSVFVAHERVYSLSYSQANDESINQIINIVEEYMSSKGMVLIERYHESLPGNWWVLKFKIQKTNKPLYDVCERPSICINKVIEGHFQISYRILCLEDFFGNSKVPKDIDLWSGFRENANTIETKDGIIQIEFLNKINQGIYGECRVW